MINKIKQKIKFHNLLFIYVVTTIIVSVVSFSRYVTTVSRESVTKVAAMANNLSVDMSIPNSAYPGFETVYPIVISNKEEDRVCEVAQKYSIKIIRENNINIPLEFALYKDEYCTIPISKNEDNMYVDDDFYFEAGVEQTQNVYLKIVWPEEQNSEYYAFEIGYFSINIIGEQID